MIKIAWMAAVTFAGLVPMKHALHMFQQNRYETGRYSTWMKENPGVISVFLPAALGLTLLYAGLSFLPVPGLDDSAVLLVMLAAFGIYQLMREKKKAYIKPLVYTNRVKRQIVTIALFNFLILFFVPRISILSFLYPMIVPWLLIYLMSVINTPIEKYVQNRFMKEAKFILQSHRDLVKIGITGSYGKTTTKNVIQSVLSERYLSLMTPASFNTPMGITRTVREYLKPIHQVFVCEMGADHVGDITELMNFVEPEIGVVTSIGPQHLQTFGSLENIIREKMQMAEKLPENGLAVLNYDNELIRNYRLNNPVQTVTYGIRYADADYRADEISYSPTGTSFTVHYKDESYPMHTAILGELNVLNILSAIAVARYLNVDWAKIRIAVERMSQVEHRLELKKINGYTFIDDAFNANPSGAGMALDVLSGMPGKRIIITPGMIDLGPQQDEINHRFGTQMKDHADEVLLVGVRQTEAIRKGLEESGFDMNRVHVFETVKEAFAYIWIHAATTDTILLENDLPDAFSH